VRQSHQDDARRVEVKSGDTVGVERPRFNARQGRFCRGKVVMRKKSVSEKGFLIRKFALTRTAGFEGQFEDVDLIVGAKHHQLVVQQIQKQNLQKTTF
jgi:hypothetical protein